MTESTPFAKWRHDGKDDPHGDYYDQDIDRIACGHMPSQVVAISLISGGHGHTLIFWLTAAKEHLRFLSRKLFKLANHHQPINEKRAKLSKGELSDDELANAFFLSESKEDLQAGHDRIMWILAEIKKLTEQN